MTAFEILTCVMNILLKLTLHEAAATLYIDRENQRTARPEQSEEIFVWSKTTNKDPTIST